MPNRLATETSPYLLQHADNPVDWYPWGAEAHERARETDRPILLSIGYSACHWCHVMEHESFEDEAIARILNENFVSIKVDREERPDLDQIYMTGLMAIRGGGGGWPLNVFLTPDHELFFGGTYWPPRSRVGSPGFDQVLLSVLDAYHSRREQVAEQAGKITSFLAEQQDMSGEPNPDLIGQACKQIIKEFDFENGGFGTAPKFPQCLTLEFMVRASRTPKLISEADVTPDSLLEMVRLNLKKMAYGGIFDHLGGGFARYSVDEKWLVPHFEKMLYDNALLAGVYLDMYQATNDSFYKMIAQKTLDYLAREMRHEEGGLFSTEDADSEGVEGKFYVWDKGEIEKLLGSDSSELFCRLYNVTESGNFEGRNILNMRQSYDDFAAANSMSKQELRDKMRQCRETLLGAREQRVKPCKDDKVIVSWNGLAISAFAKMAVASGEKNYSDIAIGIATFIQSRMVSDENLLHTYRNGEAKLNAYLDDYAFLINGLLDLYEATWDLNWIEWANELANKMIRRFGDPEGGGFFFTSIDHEPLIARTKSFQDSSIPSGNAIAASALWRLGRLVGNPSFMDVAESTLRAGVSLIERAPMAVGGLLNVLVRVLGVSRELVLFCTESNIELMNLARKCRPINSTLIVMDPGAVPVEETILAGILKGKTMMDGEPTLFICENYECQQPVQGAAQIEKELLRVHEVQV